MSAACRLVLSVILFCFTTHVIANDSTARIGVGGLVFLKNDDILTASEALSVSPKRINVRYRFRNETATAIEAVVAFPMPAFRWNMGESAREANIGPIETFTVKADGRAIAMQVEQKALLDKLDITANLSKAGLTDKQIFRSFGNMLDWRSRLPTAVTEKLKKLGAIKGDSPRWEVVETEYWQQSFPSKQDIEVEHSYKPLVGRFYDYCSTSDDFAVKKPLSGEDRN